MTSRVGEPRFDVTKLLVAPFTHLLDEEEDIWIGFKRRLSLVFVIVNHCLFNVRRPVSLPVLGGRDAYVVATAKCP